MLIFAIFCLLTNIYQKWAFFVSVCTLWSQKVVKWVAYISSIIAQSNKVDRIRVLFVYGSILSHMTIWQNI